MEPILTDMGRTVLLAEAGATKTEWAAVSASGVRRARTEGINLAIASPEQILQTVLRACDEIGKDAPLREMGSGVTGPLNVDEIRFYAAGLVSDKAMIVLDKVLKRVFPGVPAAFGTDLLAAAAASCGNEEGIVTILGTGSNSGLYDGRKIVANVRPGGFILGDEGGGCALGKAFLADWVKGLVPKDIEKAFSERFALTYADVVARVYRGPAPSAYMASFVPFLLEFRQTEYVSGLMERNLRAFIERSLMQYDLGRYKVSVVGSFGLECRPVIMTLADEYGFSLGKFVRNPIDELVAGVRAGL